MQTAAAGRPLRILVVFRNLGYVRLFDAVFRDLLARGHRVHLLHERARYSSTEAAWLEDISRHEGFTSTLSDTLDHDRWSATAFHLRRLADYLHARGPAFTSGAALVARSEQRVDPRLRRVLAPVLRHERARAALERLVLLLEASIPVNRQLVDELAGLDPDVLVLVPHLLPGSRHEEYVRAARSLRVRTCMCIASWDNLSTKQRIRELPDEVVVWNDLQRQEAIELHGVPPERIVVTGAQPFDEWFSRRPRPREAFLNLVGLDHRRPYLLYVAGALFPAGLTEPEWVLRHWMPHVRGDARLRSVGILVRPHPRRLDQWAHASVQDLEQVVVWPPEDAPMPVDEESRADFFDSIHHSAAVVGINTTAMIEGAVVGRPVHTLLAPEFGRSQLDTRHFRYLVDGGALLAASSFADHCDQLAASLANPSQYDEQRLAFVRSFVRPYGLDEPALPRVVSEIESVASRGPAPAPGVELRLVPVRLGLRLAMAVSRSLRRLRG